MQLTGQGHSSGSEDLSLLRSLLDEKSPGFSKSQRKIAAYLWSDYEHAAFLNAAEIGEKLEISEATVVRFAAALGFGGFPQLRRLLQNIVRHKVSPATRMQNKIAVLSASGEHILSQMVEMEKSSISEIQASVSAADFDAALSILLGAKRIFCFGLGASKLLAELLELRLNRFGIPTVPLIASGRDLLEKLLLLEKDDVLIAMGFAKITGELVAVLKHSAQVDCHRILLTDIQGANFEAFHPVILRVRRGPIHSFHSLNAPMTVVNALILSIAMARRDESLERLEALEQYRKLYDLDPIEAL
ncbi:MAG: RpiR family transcriptional regulator [Spirochaetes bacterium]|nr:MAG: RpiR family transcriptional regulator [Spirochaetota bacterium]